MKINGFELPEQIVEAAKESDNFPVITFWIFSQDCDAFGSYFNGREVFMFESRWNEEQEALKEYRIEHGTVTKLYEPIELPTSTEKLVAFAHEGSGTPYCLDYRASSVPSVIFPGDDGWRKLASNVEDFFDLLTKQKKTIKQ